MVHLLACVVWIGGWHVHAYTRWSQKLSFFLSLCSGCESGNTLEDIYSESAYDDDDQMEQLLISNTLLSYPNF